MPGVHEIVPLCPGDEAARALLQRAADAVAPLMTRRGWNVGRLEEFAPRSSALLGMNEGRGARILLRLRPPNASGGRSSFFPWHDVLGTMLHELAHIECVVKQVCLGLGSAWCPRVGARRPPSALHGRH